MTYTHPDALVETDWLAENLGAPGLVVLDATWFSAAAPRDAREEFARAHVPGARYFDIDAIAAPPAGLPHMLPDGTTFATRAGALGVNDTDRVVIYDSNGGAAAAARAWWMFRVFGHHDVALLNGGFAKWRSEGRPLEAGEPAPAPASFTVRTGDGKADRRLVRRVEDLLANLESGAEQVLDARGAGRFEGTQPEPWPVIKTGHIPGSRNLPFPDLLDPDRGDVLRPAGEIEARIAAAGIDATRPVVASCGSGVTAGLLAFGLYLVGRADVAIYDGSWAEWGQREDTPFETGPAEATVLESPGSATARRTAGDGE